MAEANNTGISSSRLAMWRTAVALAYIDGRLSNSEVSLIHEYTEQQPFTDAQRDILESDLRNGVNFEDVFHHITDKEDIAHLINFARVLFYIDGDFSDAEKKILDSIDADYLKTLNLKQIFSDAKQSSQVYYNQFLDEQKEEIEHERQREGFIVGRLIDPAFCYISDFVDKITGSEDRR